MEAHPAERHGRAVEALDIADLENHAGPHDAAPESDSGASVPSHAPTTAGATALAPDQQVLQHRRVLEELDVLEGAGDAEPGDSRCRAIQEAPSFEADIAFGRLVQARNQVEERGLAGAVRSHDGEDLALLHLERHPFERGDTAESQRRLPNLQQAHRIRSVFR